MFRADSAETAFQNTLFCQFANMICFGSDFRGTEPRGDMARLVELIAGDVIILKRTVSSSFELLNQPLSNVRIGDSVLPQTVDPLAQGVFAIA